MPAMSESRQVLHSLANPVMVVDAQYAHARPVWRHVYKNQRYLAVGELIEKRLLDAEGHNGHSLGVPLDHRRMQLFILSGS